MGNTLAKLEELLKVPPTEQLTNEEIKLLHTSLGDLIECAKALKKCHGEMHKLRGELSHTITVANWWEPGKEALERLEQTK